MKELNEESEEFKEIHEEWKKEMHKIKSMEELSNYIDHLLNDYEHDYGTVVHAIGCIVSAAAWFCADMAGITGFQAGCVMWEFIRNWMYTNNKTGLKIIDFDNMLYPQNKDSFEKVMDERIFDSLKKEADRLVKEEDACSEVKNHWRSIADGQVPFGWEVRRKNNG